MNQPELVIEEVQRIPLRRLQIKKRSGGLCISELLKIKKLKREMLIEMIMDEEDTKDTGM